MNNNNKQQHEQQQHEQQQQQQLLLIIMKNDAKCTNIFDLTKNTFFSSDWAQILGPSVSRPGDSENQLRFVCFFQKDFF